MLIMEDSGALRNAPFDIVLRPSLKILIKNNAYYM